MVYSIGNLDSLFYYTNDVFCLNFKSYSITVLETIMRKQTHKCIVFMLWKWVMKYAIITGNIITEVN